MKKTTLLLTLVCAFMSINLPAQQRVPSKGFAVHTAGGAFKPYEFTRHAVGDNDIEIKIFYSGICHSDLHFVAQQWGRVEFPIVAGHEIAGRVTKVGKNVTKFKVGDLAGVGCMVNSCGQCYSCDHDKEQFCPQTVLTYQSHDQFHDNELTQGGYSNNMVVVEDFAITIPSDAQIEKVAPLLCAGVTTYSPIVYAGVKRGDKVGVAGFGGLGHMAVKYMIALGAEVTVFDITELKREDAKRLGAERYVNVNNAEQLKGLGNSFDFIISTIPAAYDPNMYFQMLKFDGQLAIVGIPAFDQTPTFRIDSFVWHGNRKVFGSQIGGIKETQEAVNYSVANNIYPEVEIIPATADAINDAYKNVLDGRVKFRYVIDMTTLK